MRVRIVDLRSLNSTEITVDSIEEAARIAGGYRWDGVKIYQINPETGEKIREENREESK